MDSPMKRPSPAEVATMAVFVPFVATGLHTLLRPTPILIMHPTN
jgi:hypothetical protein